MRIWKIKRTNNNSKTVNIQLKEFKSRKHEFETWIVNRGLEVTYRWCKYDCVSNSLVSVAFDSPELAEAFVDAFGE